MQVSSLRTFDLAIMPRVLPSTRTGRWAVTLTAVFALLFLGHVWLFAPASASIPGRHAIRPILSVVLLSCGLAAGCLGILAVKRDGERGWLVWLSIIPPLMVVAFLLRLVRPPTQAG
jgi:hypothetical protein